MKKCYPLVEKCYPRGTEPFLPAGGDNEGIIDTNSSIPLAET